MAKITKSITITQYDYLLRGIHDEEPEVAEHLNHHTDFDPEGRTLRDIRYMRDGGFEEMIEYSYDPEGRLLTERFYQAEDEISEEIAYHYGDSQKAVSAEKRYADGSLVSIGFEYNDQGLLIRKTYTDEDDQIEQTEVFTYEKGSLIKVEAFDEEGNLMSIPYQDETLSSRTRVTRNDAGQVILEEELDMNEEVIMSVSRSYLDDGRPSETEVFMDGQGRAISRHYILRYSYTFFDE
jgi:hypothetical protein